MIFFKIWQWILQLLRIKKITKLSCFVVSPEKMFGYGLSNDLLQLPLSEVSKMAEAMAVAGVPVTHIEVLSFGEMGYYSNPQQALDLLKPRVKEFQKRRITTKLNLENHNFNDICNQKYDDRWFQYMVDWIKNELGMEGIEIQGASEYGPKCRNSKCWRKAASWCKWLAANWSGMLGNNKGCRPRKAVARHTNNYHSASVSDTAPRNSVVVTDHSTLLHQIGGFCCNFDVAKTMSFMRACHRAGCGCVLYHFASGAIGATSGIKPDYAIIEAIGEMIKTLPKR